MSPLNASSRRAVLFSGLAACLPSGLLAASDDMDYEITASLYQQVAYLRVQALLAMKAGNAMGALTHINAARAIVSEKENKRWPLWIYVNPAYGQVLVHLGKYKEAISALLLARATEDKMRNGSSEKLSKLITGLEGGMVKLILHHENIRQFASLLDAPGPKPQTLKDLLLDQTISTADTLVILVRAYLGNDDLQDAVVILNEQIYAAEQPQHDKEVPPVALEYRLFKMGAAFSEAGHPTEARRAFNAALSLNAYRLRVLVEYVPSPEILLAAYGVRRLEISAVLGNDDFETLPHIQTKALLAHIVETKGLGIRYAETVNRLLALSTSPTVIAARQHLSAIEDQMIGLGNDTQGLLRLFQLASMKWNSLRTVMPELVSAGLGDVFQDGSELLAQGQAALGNGGLIGFMAYTPLSTKSFAYEQSRYLRYCVAGDTLQLRDLGLKGEIDRLVFSWRQRVLSGTPDEQVGRQLGQVLLGNLPKSMLDRREWTVDPDGALCLLPFEALPSANGKPLIESVKLAYLTSFAQLTTPKRPYSTAKARIIADPLFQGTDAGTPPNRAERRSMTKIVLKGRTVESMELASLPETRAEARAVGAALKKMGIESDTYLGSRSDIHAFEMTEAPRFLHIATHGVLLNPDSTFSVSDADPLTKSEYIGISLPGRNSGLAVAGTVRPELILAKDIAQLPLLGTELVVLSACDTGNGSVDVGEGIASLRRAVETAGAEASITSLWPVPSAKTTELMASFYGYLAKGLGKREALHQAKVDAKKLDPTPYSWAGFVLAGRV